MDGSAYRQLGEGLGKLFKIMFPLAIAGLIALVVGLAYGMYWLFSHLSWVS